MRYQNSDCMIGVSDNYYQFTPELQLNIFSCEYGIGAEGMRSRMDPHYLFQLFRPQVNAPSSALFGGNILGGSGISVTSGNDTWYSVKACVSRKADPVRCVEACAYILSKWEVSHRRPHLLHQLLYGNRTSPGIMGSLIPFDIEKGEDDEWVLFNNPLSCYEVLKFFEFGGIRFEVFKPYLTGHCYFTGYHAKLPYQVILFIFNIKDYCIYPVSLNYYPDDYHSLHEWESFVCGKILPYGDKVFKCPTAIRKDL